MSVVFSNLDTNFKFRQKRLISACIKQMITENAKKIVGDISIVFCSDKIILETNKNYLNHDYYTDIITFDYCDKNIISGDLLISVDTVRNNAKEYKVEFIEELHRVILHGILHLLGQKDKSKKDSQQMRVLEDESLKLLAELANNK